MDVDANGCYVQIRLVSELASTLGRYESFLIPQHEKTTRMDFGRGIAGRVCGVHTQWVRRD